MTETQLELTKEEFSGSYNRKSLPLSFSLSPPTPKPCLQFPLVLAPFSGNTTLMEVGWPPEGLGLHSPRLAISKEKDNFLLFYQAKIQGLSLLN